MPTQDEIKHYDSPKPHLIKRINPLEFEIFCGDSLPPIGNLVRVESTPPCLAKVTQHLGQRTAQIELLSPAPFAPNSSPKITLLQTKAALPDTQDLLCAHYVSAQEPGAIPTAITPPPFLELFTTLPALTSTLPTLDLLAPMTQGGTQLILDASGERDALFSTLFESLDFTKWTLSAHQTPLLKAQATHYTLSPNAAPQSMKAALRLIEHHAVALDNLVVVDLSSLVAPRPPLFNHTPRQESPPAFKLSQLLALTSQFLISTHSRRFTTAIYMNLGPELQDLGTTELIETLGLGDVHTQLFVQADGKLDPMRSRSSAEVQDPEQRKRAQTLAQQLYAVTKLKEKSQIFGLDELSEEEQELLRDIQRIDLRLVNT